MFVALSAIRLLYCLLTLKLIVLLTNMSHSLLMLLPLRRLLLFLVLVLVSVLVDGSPKVA